MCARSHLESIETPLVDLSFFPENLWGYKKRLAFVHHHAARIAARRILDIGCGNGSQLSLPLSRLGYEVTGVDPHEPSISRARRAGCATFIAGFSTELPTEPFDVVIISEVLEHLEAPDQLLSDSLRFIAPGGLLIVTVPNGYGEFEIDSRLYRKFRLATLFDGLYQIRRKILNKPEPLAEVSSSDDGSGHVQRFTLARLNDLFSAQDLTIEDRRATSFCSGPFIANIIGRSQTLINLNARIADYLPMALNSDWMFCLRKSSDLSSP